MAAASFWLNAAGLMMSPARPERAMRAVAVKITVSGLRVDADTNWIAFQVSRLSHEGAEANDIKKIMTHKKIYGIIFYKSNHFLLLLSLAEHTYHAEYTP